MRSPAPSLGIGPAAWGGLVLIIAACGSSAIQWKSRPSLPRITTWHCLDTGSGSLCEKTFDACRNSHRYVSQHTVAVQTTNAECTPSEEVWCFSYVLAPKHAPSSPEYHSVREPGVDGWVYDCARTQATCETNQRRVAGDRAESGDPTDDVAPCERWDPEDR